MVRNPADGEITSNKELCKVTPKYQYLKDNCIFLQIESTTGLNSGHSGSQTGLDNSV